MIATAYPFTRHALISPAYLTQQRELHARPNGYGGGGGTWAAYVRELLGRFVATSVLDYGCGEGGLMRALRPLCNSTIRLDEYDIAMPGKDEPASFADLVVCTDVLEHIEPDRLDTVLAHLKMLARKAVFAAISTRPSNKTLADGRNAHLIVEGVDWWRARVVAAGFDVADGPTRLHHGKPVREWAAVLTERTS